MYSCSQCLDAHHSSCCRVHSERLWEVSRADRWHTTSASLADPLEWLSCSERLHRRTPSQCWWGLYVDIEQIRVSYRIFLLEGEMSKNRNGRTAGGGHTFLIKHNVIRVQLAWISYNITIPSREWCTCRRWKPTWLCSTWIKQVGSTRYMYVTLPGSLIFLLRRWKAGRSLGTRLMMGYSR